MLLEPITTARTWPWSSASVLMTNSYSHIFMMKCSPNGVFLPVIIGMTRIYSTPSHFLKYWLRDAFYESYF